MQRRKLARVGVCVCVLKPLGCGKSSLLGFVSDSDSRQKKPILLGRLGVALSLHSQARRCFPS